MVRIGEESLAKEKIQKTFEIYVWIVSSTYPMAGERSGEVRTHSQFSGLGN